MMTVLTAREPPPAAEATSVHRRHEKYQRLLDCCKALSPTPTAVVHPCDETSLRGPVEAAELKLLLPILVGPQGKIESAAKQHGIDISRYEIIDSPHSHAAAESAVRLFREAKAEMWPPRASCSARARPSF